MPYNAWDACGRRSTPKHRKFKASFVILVQMACTRKSESRPLCGQLHANVWRQLLTTMKLHHAAALALIGWFLMAPPASPGPNGSFVTKTNLPLALWNNIGSYDQDGDCEEERRAFLDLKRTEPPSSPGFAQESLGTKLSIVSSWSAVCVSSDDPRLKSD